MQHQRTSKKHGESYPLAFQQKLYTLLRVLSEEQGPSQQTESTPVEEGKMENPSNTAKRRSSPLISSRQDSPAPVSCDFVAFISLLSKNVLVARRPYVAVTLQNRFVKMTK